MAKNNLEVNDPDLDDIITDFLLWLDKFCRDMQYEPNHSIRRTKRYIAVDNDFGVVCFISKTDQETKTVGKMKRGDILYPIYDAQPAKTPRGSIFDKEDWERLFDRKGMKGLKSASGKRKQKINDKWI